MRIRNGNLYLNPFGTYHGKQRHHATYGSGLGARAAVFTAPQFFPLAPSYNGATEELMMAVFSFKTEPDSALWEQAIGFCEGSIPVEELTKDFCYPRKTTEIDSKLPRKKIMTSIPISLQAKIMINSLS